MKVAITGHQFGLGKELHTLWPDAVIFEDGNSESEIIQKVYECDIFINNLHESYSQVRLLYIAHNVWKHFPNKKIICISSATADDLLTFPCPYAIESLALAKACEQLSHTTDTLCKISCIKLGTLDTDTVTYSDHFGVLSVKEVAKYIEQLIGMGSTLWLSKVTIVPNRGDE